MDVDLLRGTELPRETFDSKTVVGTHVSIKSIVTALRDLQMAVAVAVAVSAVVPLPTR